ncbi:hypothetical protein PR202_ga06372 [Eleusine coracana subsp. coracana]|uniref:Titin-like n=1 Tax=Eleusine coracana subsp. coracana TaxID=191504 RepID=A0AAV5BX01_ELECO|nr:hypothetical protein PR202_ga06372 [Eleusine coracana subsp. coracana]
MQTRLDSKLSSMEIKNVAETIDSTEGTLKIPEDQVLVDAPSEIKLPLEHNPNGTSSSLNGHMDEENKISNEQLQGDSKKDREQINRVNKLVPRNADAVQEDIPKCEESGVSKEMPKSEHADESTTDAQEVLHQEPSEDTNGLAYEKREQTSQQSSMAASDDTTSEHTTSEPPVDIQVQNKKSLEEMKDADAVDTEAAMQEKYIAFEEATPEYHVATTEQDSVETNNTEITNVATVDEANKEKNMPGIESEVTKSTEPVETEEDSDQRHFSLLDNSAQGDDMPVSEKKHTGSALEKNEIEATTTESVTGESKASVSEEPSPQDYVTESEATSDSKEVNTTESSEKTREILDQNSMNSAGKSTQENNAPESEPTSEIQPEELESEEMKVNKLVQVNESSPKISATVFHKKIQENNPMTSELHVMESGGMRNIETTEVQVTPHQFNSDHPEEKTTEETITSSEPQTLEPESVKKMNDIEASKPQDISQQSIISPSEKSVPEEIAKEDTVTIESIDGHQQSEDPESAELDEIKTNKSQEIASSSIIFSYEGPTSQDDVTVTEPNSETQAENVLSAEVMEDTENVKGHGALSGEVAKEENVETETIADMSPVQEPELEEAKNTEPVGTEDNITPSELPAERMEKETVEIEAIPHESPVASIRDVTENDILTAITPHADIQPVLEQESVEDKCTDTTEKPRETQQIVSSPSDKLIPPENKMAMAEPACETTLQNVIAQGIKDCEDAQTDQISNLDSFPTPGEADQENKLPGIEPTSDDQELGSTEQTIGIKAMETEDHQQHRVFTLEETAVNKKSNVDDHQVHEEKLDNEAMEVESVLEQSNISTPYNAHEDRSELGTDPDCCVQQAEQLQKALFKMKLTHLLAWKKSMNQNHLKLLMFQEVQELGSIEQTRGVEATETEDHQQYIVSTLDEPEVDKKPNVDDHQVHEEKPAELIDNGAMEAEPVLEQSNISTTDNPPEERSERGTDPYCCVQPAQQEHEPKSLETSDVQEVQELDSIEETRGVEATEIKDHQQHRVSTLEESAVDKPNVDDHQVHEEKPAELKDNEAMEAEPVLEQSNISTPDNAPAQQKHERKSLETSDVQEVQDLGSIEQTRGTEATETEDHQQHRVSTLEEPAVDKKPNVDDHQVHDEKPAELKDNEAMEAEPVLEQSNISTSDNAPEERSELGTDPDCCVHPAQQVESSRDSEDSKLLKEEETSDQKIITLEDTGTVGIVEDEFDPPVSMEQEHEQKSVEEVKDINANEAKEDFHTNQPDALDKLASESNTATAEPTYDIQHLDDFETKETKSIEGIDDGDISCQQAGVATSVDPSPTDNEIAPQEHPVESHEENLGNETENEMLDRGMKEEIHRSAEPKKSKNLADEDVIQSSGEDTLESSNDKDINRESVTERGTTEISQALIGNDAQASQECYRGRWKQRKVASMNDTKEDEEVETQKEQLQADEQKHKDESDDGSNEPLVESKNTDNGTTNRTRETDMLELEPSLASCVQDISHTSPSKDHILENFTTQLYSPEKTEEIGENKGFSSIYKPVVETSEQNNVEQDLSIQHKVEDEKLESTEDNAVEMEATQQKVDTSNVDISNDDQLSTSNALTKHETESADDVLQLETEGNTFELCEKTEASNTSVLETVTLTEEICDKVTEVEGGLSDKSLKTFDDARRNLDVSSVVRETNEESMNEDMEENKLAAPEHPTMDETTPKQQISVSEKPLPIEPEEPDDQIHKKQDEKDMYEPNFGDDQKEVEQDLPVSNFLMNLILGKENSNANGHSEPEAETKQEETRDDNSCSIIPKQEESLVLPPTENNMECKLTVEQEQKDVKCPEEKYEVVEEQSHDFKLGTETSLETDAEFNKNSHHLELPPYQDKMQDEISNEILSKEPAEAFAKIEAKDLAIPSIIQDDKEVDNVCQENTEAATQNEIRSIKNNLDDFKNTKISEEDTPGEGETGLLPECLNEARSVNSVSEQTLLLTDSGMTDAKSLPSPNPVCEIQDKTIESSSIGATSIPDIQVESEEDKIEKKQPTTTATGDVAEEHVEISNDNPQKSIGPETTSNEQEPQIAQQVNDTEIVLGHEKKILAGSSSTFMDKKEDSNFSVKEGNNIQTAVEIQADGPNMQVNQDKQEAADIKNETESEKLKESNIQEKQGNDTEEKSPKECHEEDQQFLVKEEIGVKEEDVHQTVQSHTETVKIKANDEQKLSDSEVQERDFNVFSPKDVREPHESFVDTANPECRTDEEQSPKADESNISEQKTYEGKTKDEEKIKSFTDEEMKTEAQVTGEKAAHKKQNLLSGVGSKVKHQLAKVKKAITGKPGHTKPKSPKA